MILCDDNYGLGAYGMDSVHNREPRAKPGSHLVIYNVIDFVLRFRRQHRITDVRRNHGTDVRRNRDVSHLFA